MSREATAPETAPAAPRVKHRRQRDTKPVEDGVRASGWRDPQDTPCVNGRVPLWPGGPALPAWAEREARLGDVYDTVRGVIRMAQVAAAKQRQKDQPAQNGYDLGFWRRGTQRHHFTCWICKRAHCLEGIPYERHWVCVRCYKAMHRNHVRVDPNCWGCRAEYEYGARY